MKKSFPTLCLLVVTLMMLAMATQAMGAYQFKAMYPEIEQPWYFVSPFDMAVDAEGNVYVADESLRKFNSDGQALTLTMAGNEQPSITLGPTGESFIRSVALDAEGNIYLTDQLTHSVTIISTEGEILEQWGSEGIEDGQFRTPSGIAVGADGSVFVGELGGNRIQKFNSSGAFLKSWYCAYAGSDGCNGISDLAVDSEGCIHVVTTRSRMISTYDDQGNLLHESDLAPGSFDGITIGEDDRVYAVSYVTNDIWVYSTDGVAIDILGNSPGEATFFRPGSIAVSGDGSVYVGESKCYIYDTESFGPLIQIQKTDSRGKPLAKWTSSGDGPGQFFEPRDVAVSPDGSIYVADASNSRIQKFDAGFQYLLEWEIDIPTTLGKGTHPIGVAVNSGGDVYVIAGPSVDNNIAAKYSPSGELLASFLPPDFGKFSGGASNISVDSNDLVYVADDNLHKIYIFQSDGSSLGSIDISQDNEGLIAPISVAFDENGLLIVAQSVIASEGLPSGVIRKFTQEGTLISQWDMQPVLNKEYSVPGSVACDADGNIFVTDMKSSTIQIYSPTGEFLDFIGQRGHEAGQLRVPYGLALAGNGDLYVADTYNNRIQAFANEDADASNYTGFWLGAGSAYYTTEFVLEGSGDTILFNSHSFDESGQAVWYEAVLKNIGGVFSGALLQFSGWPLEGNNPSQGTTVEELGNLTLSFSDLATAMLTFDNGSSLEYSPLIRPENTEFDSRDITGWWWDPAYSGMGLFLQASDSKLDAAWYHYRADGSARWWRTSGDFPEDSTSFTGDLIEYVDGPTLFGEYAIPTSLGSQGEVNFTFNDDGTATMTWGDVEYSLQRFGL